MSLPWSMSTWSGAFIRGKKSSTKWKKYIWFFIFQKYGKFWSISLGYFIKHKPLISEKCESNFFSTSALISSPTPLLQNPMYELVPNDDLQTHFIPKERITKQHEIASGHFGKVFKGMQSLLKLLFFPRNFFFFFC